MTRLFEFAMEEQIACIERELALREKVYGRWIKSGKMTRKKAEHEYACMRAVLHTLQDRERRQKPKADGERSKITHI